MISKSYLAENDENFFKNNKSTLFYGENIGLKNLFKKTILKENKNKVIKFYQEEILKNTESFFNEILNQSLFEEKKIFF